MSALSSTVNHGPSSFKHIIIVHQLIDFTKDMLFIDALEMDQIISHSLIVWFVCRVCLDKIN